MSRAIELRKMGFANVAVVDGGILAWILDGLPLAPSEDPAKAGQDK